ncbi:Dimer-Tnp-hAT domain-containing protein [Pyrenophora tritici-repentis]|nr:Dimer-Tnp-hAT domain-containing protein [Pyrenophora tritici-repentis]
MPLNRPPKRPRGDAFAPNKRARVAARGTESQPIDIDKSQQPAQRLSPRKALAITTSQATEPPTFESQLRESQPEAAIVAPTEGSSAATAVITEDDEDSNEDSDKRLDERFADNFDGIDWSRLPLYCKPVSTQKQRKSWIYRYGYRVALIKDPDRLFFVCRYCHQHKWIDARQGGIYETTLSTTSACHLEQVRRGHSLTAPSKTHSITKAGKGGLRALLKAASVKVLQGLANELGGFDCQAFRHAAVAWLIDSNHPLSEFQKPAFRQMLKAANVEAAAALWTSHASVSRELAVESELLRNWREDGPLGVLLSVINYIRTPQQLELFEKFQRIANAELLADQREVLAPVKPVVTRWNSYYSAFERAVKLQPAVNAYAHHHICRVRDEDTYAISRGNKLPEAADWMRSGGLTAADWAVVTEYIDVLKPLKSATKRLEGRGKDTEGRVGGGLYGAIAEVIPVFEYILTYYEQRVKAYEAANDYYTKLDLSPAYYAATLLHPRYKTYCEVAWADKPEWLEANNRTFHELWAEYNTSPRAVRRPKVISNEIDDAIDALLDPDGAVAATDGYMDEYERWKACEPKASKGSYAAVHPIKYWVGLRDRYPSLAQMAIDMLSIPASSCECERMFSELGDLLEPRRRQISPQLLAAIQCVWRWHRAGFDQGDDSAAAATMTDADIDAIYQLCDWDYENEYLV